MSGTNVDAMDILERFVIDNDDLLALEERIGRFNIFDALGIVRAEIRHSNFLAWLLNPSGSHGQGDVFLKAVLMDLFKHARASGHPVPISPVELDGGDLNGVEVRREWNRIDLLLVDRERSLIVAIENKVDSGEHSNQLNRYENELDREFHGWRRLLVYLTPAGIGASDEDWAPYSYERLRDVLVRVKRTSAGSLGTDVAAFIEHYLNLLETRLMDDKKIVELCRRIYANHKRAIDLIVEHAGAGGSAVLQEVENVVKSRSQKWAYARTGVKTVDFTYRPLLGVTPLKSGDASESWLNMNFNVWTEGYLSAQVWVWRCDDMAKRRRVMERISKTPTEFGLKLFKRGLDSDNWASLGRKQILRLSEDDSNADEIARAVNKQLDDWEAVFDRMIPVIQQVP